MFEAVLRQEVEEHEDRLVRARWEMQCGYCNPIKNVITHEVTHIACSLQAAHKELARDCPEIGDTE